MTADNVPKINKAQASEPTTETEALRRDQLVQGRYYTCVLSGRRVLHTGDGDIKWHNAEHDEYREAKASNYQLIPLRPQ